MKTRSATIILFSILFIAGSCKRNLMTVEGKWRPVGLDPTYVQSFHLSNDQVKDMLDKSVIGFLKGGEFFSYESRDTVKGKYTYDEKQKRLYTTPDGKNAQTFTVEFLQPDEIMLTNEYGKMTLKRL